jgi:hypothetical protein
MLSAVAFAAIAMIPVSASAAPTPSPSLETVLAQPPTGFSELNTSPFHGSFTAHDYAQASGSSKADEIEKTLNQYGFVDGFGKTWIHQTDQHALVEAVMAFRGAKGAKDWMTAAQADDKKDPTYAHSDSVDGISTYYGGHFKYSSSSTEGDVFSFVKGNDLFIVGFVSTKDDVLSLAQNQAKSQYNTAPNETIPSSQWPENVNKGGGFSGIAIGLIVGLVIFLAVVAIGVTMMRRQGRMTPAMAGATGTGGAAGVQMSGDGKYWWDGQAWRDAGSEAPPSAQRSADGALWWDGQTWRPVPSPAAAPPDVPPAG